MELLVRFVQHAGEARVLKAQRERELVIVDVLPEVPTTSYDERTLTDTERFGDRADAGVADDGASSRHVAPDFVRRDESEACRHLGSQLRRAALDHDLLGDRRPVECGDEPIERVRRRTDRHEDHEAGNDTLPAYRPPRTRVAASGHWT